jgi:hypothetical protein
MKIMIQIDGGKAEVFLAVPTIEQKIIVCKNNNEVLRAIHQLLMEYWDVNKVK